MRKNQVLNKCEIDCRNVNPPIPNLSIVLSQNSHSYRHLNINPISTDHHDFIRIITKRPKGHTHTPNVPKSYHRRFQLTPQPKSLLLNAPTQRAALPAPTRTAPTTADRTSLAAPTSTRVMAAAPRATCPSGYAGHQHISNNDTFDRSE